jgi:NodT family efflux transporter outer membrane factor (OMF) lipoprotein
MFRTLVVCLAASIAAQAAKQATPKVEVSVPAAFHNQPPGTAGGVPEEWWNGFGDPLLARLIERAARNNYDVRKAAARLAESEALRRTSRSALLPEITGNASATQLRGGFSQGVVRAPAPGSSGGGNLVSPFETSVLSGGFQMRWEIDVFRGLSKSLKASAADAQAAAENLRDVQTIVRADVARNYVELRAAEDQLAIVRATVASEEELLMLIRVRADAGLSSDLDVERQVAQLASFRAAIPDVDTLRLQAIHRIAVLLGEEPGALKAELEAPHSGLQAPSLPSVPSEALKQRPDIRRAEAQIAAAFSRAGAARADLYPKIVITGLSGRQATDAGGLTLGAGNFFSFGPGISLPILNFGRIRSQIAAREAQLEYAVRAYEQDLLGAFEETENAFVTRERAAERRRELDTGIAAARRSVDLARELYVRGLGDFLTVLDAQRQQFAIERELAAADASVLRATVALYKALGR